MPEKYDVIVIGGGPGGLSAAESAAREGKRVLIIDRDGWGGTCTHRGCIPTKALLTSSKFYAGLKRLKRAGINVSGASADFPAMKRHQRQLVTLSALGSEKVLADAKAEARAGTGEIISPREVRFTGQSGESQILSAGNVVIAWGSVPHVLPCVSLSERVLTSDGILELETLPSSMLIVGGSVIGAEFATFFAEMGVKVTLIEMLDRILHAEDAEATDMLGRELARLGVTIHTSAELQGLEDTGDGVVARARKNGEALEFNANIALLCTGRKPVLNTGELDRLGIEYSHSGIPTDGNMMTNVDGVYAVGDVTGGMMLAHRAAFQGKIAAGHICGAAPLTYDESTIPSVVYSHPQIARVGYTESTARDENLPVDIVKSQYGANIIARAEIMGRGFVKAVFSDGKMIGATVVGENAADLIVPLTLAVTAGLTREQLRSWVLPHPTLSEVFLPLLGGRFSI